MKQPIHVQLPLWGLALLSCSLQLGASQQFLNAQGGNLQAPMAPPQFGGIDAQLAAAQQLLAAAPTAPSGMAPVQTLEATRSDTQANFVAQDCNCSTDAKVSINLGAGTCSVSKVTVHQDHAAKAGITLTAVSAIWGNTALSKEQREKVTLAKVSETSFHCMDDRVTHASLFTPGGDLGEFILALSSYLQERDPSGQMRPSQEVVDALLEKYVETIPSTRPMIHCTDDRAIAHLETEMPLENLDLSSPPDVSKAPLLKMLTEVENHGDSHMRLMLKKPEWFQLNKYLVPMVVKSFYHLLWQQNSDPKSALHKSPKLKLEVLVGQSDAQGFLEVSSGKVCHAGDMAPMLTPRTPQRAVLISHLDAVSLRRAELASFFTRIANASPRKINPKQLGQRLDRHGWLALETTGSHIASGLPFFTLTYS